MKYNQGDKVMFINADRFPMIGYVMGKSTLAEDTYKIQVYMGADGMVNYAIHERDVVCGINGKKAVKVE